MIGAITLVWTLTNKFRLLDGIGNCYIPFAIANHVGCRCKSHSDICHAEVLRGQSKQCVSLETITCINHHECVHF